MQAVRFFKIFITTYQTKRVSLQRHLMLPSIVPLHSGSGKKQAGLVWGTVPAFVWRDWRKPQEISGQNNWDLAEIWTEHLLNMRVVCQYYTKPLGLNSVITHNMKIPYLISLYEKWHQPDYKINSQFSTISMYNFIIT